MIKIPRIPESVVLRHGGKAWPLGLTGAGLLIIGSLLSWSFDPQVLGNLSISLNPGGLQILAIAQALLAVVLLLAHKGPLSSLGQWADTALGLRALATWALIYMAMVIAAIGAESGGLVNVEPGGWISLLGAAVLFAASRLILPRRTRDLGEARLPGWAEILVIVVLMAVILFGSAYALALGDAWSFVLFLVFVTGVVTAGTRAGLLTWLGHVTTRHKHVLTLAAFAVAFFFPFTQNGSDANMSIASQVLIFAGTALGLNIVVGLVGLLDLGYIAFLGAGAFTAAILSGSAFSTVDWTPPFWLTVLIAGTVTNICCESSARDASDPGAAAPPLRSSARNGAPPPPARRRRPWRSRRRRRSAKRGTD